MTGQVIAWAVAVCLPTAFPTRWRGVVKGLGWEEGDQDKAMEFVSPQTRVVKPRRMGIQGPVN